VTGKKSAESYIDIPRLDESFSREYLPPDQRADVSAILEAHTARDAMAGDIEQRHEILSAFVFYVEQHSAASWPLAPKQPKVNRQLGRVPFKDKPQFLPRLPYAYARYLADFIKRVVEQERAHRPGGRPPRYKQDEIAAAVALLVLRGIPYAPGRLAKELGLSTRAVEMARSKGGYEIAHVSKTSRGAGRTVTRYTVHPNAKAEVLKRNLGTCAAAVVKISNERKRPKKPA
jgi:hypothetical protein